MRGSLLSGRFGLDSSTGDIVSRFWAALVVVHRLSHRAGPVAPDAKRLCPLGLVDGTAVRNWHLDRFSTDADAGHVLRQTTEDETNHALADPPAIGHAAPYSFRFIGRRWRCPSVTAPGQLSNHRAHGANSTSGGTGRY